MKTITRSKSIKIVLLLGYTLLQSVDVQSMSGVDEKVYVAVEGEGRVVVLETPSGRKVASIDVSRSVWGRHIDRAPHNIQVAPDGQTVWVTANGVHGSIRHQSARSVGSAHSDETTIEHANTDHESELLADEVLIINPLNETIIKRIPIAIGAHLAHVVVTQDGASAFVTAENESAIYKIDARNYRVERKILFPSNAKPHGLRLTPDGLSAYVALLKDKSLGVLDLQSNQTEMLPLDGAPVQTAVTRDGKRVLASLYDTKKIAVYDLTTRTLDYLDLPKNAQGPVQLYPSPDSRYLYVADQGHYFGQPDGNQVFKVDLQQMRIVDSFQAGNAPHGIVVSMSGDFAYVTNLVSNDLSFINLKTGKESLRISMGKEPNGVSIWNKKTGGAP